MLNAQRRGSSDMVQRLSGRRHTAPRRTGDRRDRVHLARRTLAHPGDACAPGTCGRGRPSQGQVFWEAAAYHFPLQASGRPNPPLRAGTPAHPGDARVPGTRTWFNSNAKRVGHRSGAAFTAEDARASRSNASRFAVHTLVFEVLCALGVSAVRFCGDVIVAYRRETEGPFSAVCVRLRI